MALPPSDAGAVNDTEADAFPPVAELFDGGAGVVGRTVMTNEALPEQHSRDCPSVEVRMMSLSPGLLQE